MKIDQINEKWSEKYKRSIDCDNPRGFSQRAHCAGRKKTNEELTDFNKDEPIHMRVYLLVSLHYGANPMVGQMKQS